MFRYGFVGKFFCFFKINKLFETPLDLAEKCTVTKLQGKFNPARGLYAKLITSQLKLHTHIWVVPILSSWQECNIPQMFNNLLDIARFERENMFLNQSFDAQGFQSRRS